MCLPLLAAAYSDPASHHSLHWDVRLHLPNFSGHQENFQRRWKNNPGWKFSSFNEPWIWRQAWVQTIKLIQPATENFSIFQEEYVLKCHPNAHSGIFSYVLNKVPDKDPTE